MSSSDPPALSYPNHHNYAFLAEHIPDDVPSRDEFGSIIRQKRRRTSPQGQAILEAAYLKNSKPDKSERMQIVSQVALGEKEVQVWYQNRRQADRRKSRPLLPHELVPHFRNGVPLEVLQHSPLVPPLDRERLAEVKCTTAFMPRDEQQPISRASSIHELLNSSSFSDVKASSAPTTQESVDQNVSLSSSFEQSENLENPTHSTDFATVVTDNLEMDTGIPGARKRTHQEMIGSIDTSTKNPAEEPPKIPSQSSLVRLSMTADGAVKIRTSDRATPSPPKDRAPAPDLDFRRSSGLQRSRSAIGPMEMGTDAGSLPLNLRAAEGKLGRSRDARTWEFYCDSETRDSLSSHAEYERNGSAVGAINLIRSQSQRQLRQMLAPIASRTNARVPARGDSNGPRSKPKLSRTKSSLARLQGAEGDFSKFHKDLRPTAHRSPSGDSDKENWAPGTHGSRNVPRKEHLGVSDRPILVENASVLGQIRQPDRGGGSRVTATEFDEKENRVPAPADFREKGSDLDCVQGLLSLSQGAWR